MLVSYSGDNENVRIPEKLNAFDINKKMTTSKGHIP